MTEGLWCSQCKRRIPLVHIGEHDLMHADEWLEEAFGRLERDVIEVLQTLSLGGG